MLIHIFQTGIVFIFSRPSSLAGWSQLKILINSNQTLKNFGWSVAVSASNNTLMVGAPAYNNNGRTYSGAVLVYSMSPADRTITTYVTTIKAPTPVAKDTFGYSIALGTDAVFIGTIYTGFKH